MKMLALVVLLFAIYVCQGEDATLVLLEDAAEAVGSYATDYNYDVTSSLPVCLQATFVCNRSR